MVSPNQEAVSLAHSLLSSSLAKVEGVRSAAFFGFSPVVSKKEDPDLDVVVVTDTTTDRSSLEVTLQQVAVASQLIIDAWILSEEELLERMKRFSAQRQQPLPQISLDNWSGPAFISILGHELLTQLILSANTSPVNEAPIPPSPSSKAIFRP